MKNRRILASVISAGVLIASMVASVIPAHAAVDLKIGISQPITGGLATYGPPSIAAAEFGVASVSDAMKKAGVAGSCKVVGSEDDAASPAVAVEAATKLVKSNGANVIIGPLTSGATIAAAQSVTIPNKVVLISTAASSPTISRMADNDLVFRTYASDALTSKAGALALVREGYKGKQIAIAARNDAFGEGYARALRSAWILNKGKVASFTLYNPSQASFDSDALKITSKAVDAFYIIGYEDDLAKLIPALVRTGKWDPKKTFLNETINNDASAIKVGGPGAKLIEGVHGIANAAAGFELADWKKDFAKYAPKISQTFVDSSAFDAAVLACLAGVHAGKSDGASISKSLRFVSGARGGTAYTYKELDKAVKDLAAGKAVSYTGPWGAVKFDAAGDSKAAVFDVYEVKGGKVVIDPKLQISYQK